MFDEHTANAEEFVESIEPNQKMSAIKQAQETGWKDVITITIPARGDKECKLILTKGATLEYAWQTDKGELFFDFHGEPQGDTTGYFKTFEKDTKSRTSGSLTTIFPGTHGWYWKNTTKQPIKVTLTFQGEYTSAKLN